MKIILASQSKYRRELLDRLKIKYTAKTPTIDEELLKSQAHIKIEDLPLYLARKKAESLIPEHSQDILIGCDQMAILNGQKLDKPGTVEKAINQLLALQGRKHTLITAMAICTPTSWWEHVDITHLTMKLLHEEQIRNYVRLEHPLDCAGSYKVESLGIGLFTKIETSDFTAIAGLPLLALSRFLDEYNLSSF